MEVPRGHDAQCLGQVRSGRPEKQPAIVRRHIQNWQLHDVSHRHARVVLRPAVQPFGGPGFKGPGWIGIDHRQGRSKYAGLSGLGWHELAEKVHGIPFELAALEDCIFENLPNNLAMTWPERFITAIPEGADLSKVWPRFAHWLLVDSQDGVIRFADAETGEAIWGVAMLFAREIADEIPSDEEWEAAGAAAGAAAWVAARAAAWEAAGAAARAAARAAAWEAAGAAAWAAAGAAARAAAWEAAGAAAWAAAWKAAWEAAILRQSEKLLELLSTAPVNASV